MSRRTAGDSNEKFGTVIGPADADAHNKSKTITDLGLTNMASFPLLLRTVNSPLLNGKSYPISGWNYNRRNQAYSVRTCHSRARA